MSYLIKPAGYKALLNLSQTEMGIKKIKDFFQQNLSSELRFRRVTAPLSLGLAVFGEVFCSVGFIFGAFYRLAMIPMVFTMGMAFFVIHGNDPFAVKELAFIYLVVFVLMYITGPGKFSIDHVISSALYKKKHLILPLFFKRRLTQQKRQE